MKHEVGHSNNLPSQENVNKFFDKCKKDSTRPNQAPLQFKLESQSSVDNTVETHLSSIKKLDADSNHKYKQLIGFQEK